MTTRDTDPAWSNALVAMFVAFSTAFGCGEAPQPRGPGFPFLPYHGRLAEHPRFPELADEVQALLPAAAERASSRLGVPVFTGRCRYRFVDHAETGSSTHARTISTAGGELIQLNVPLLLHGTFDPLTLLAHELAHATLIHDAGPRYTAMPVWLQEGLAVHAADDLEATVAVSLAWADVEEAGDIADGLAEDGAHTWVDYAEDVLAIDYLITKGGEDAVQRFVREVIGGLSWQEALELVSRLPVETFTREATEHARLELERRAGSRHGRYRQACAEADAGRCEEARRLLGPLAAEPGSAFRAPAAYRDALCALAEGSAREAEAALSALLVSDRARFVDLGGLLYWSHVARAALGDERGADERCAEMLSFGAQDPARRARCENRLRADAIAP